MAKIHPSAIVEDGADIALDVEIEPFVVIGGRVRLGAGVRVMSHAVVSGATHVGEATVIYPHAVIGGGPQYRGDPGTDARIVIGSNNVIREHVTINGGSLKGGGLTTVGSRGYFMAYSHIGHDCHIGDGVTFANGVALGGHVTIEDGVNIGGLAAIQQFGRIGRYAFVGGVTGVPGDVIPYGMVWGDRAKLQGLNLVGLKRRGLSRAHIHAMRAAFRLIFLSGAPLAQASAEAAERWPEIVEIREITEFIRSERKHPLCMPPRVKSGGSEAV